MKKYTLKDFVRGWIVGSGFTPSIYKNDVELGFKYYNRNDYERSHCHLLSDELTIILLGEVAINGIKYVEGDIIVQERGDFADFHVISERAITGVFRPDGSFPNDKYFKED